MLYWLTHYRRRATDYRRRSVAYARDMYAFLFLSGYPKHSIIGACLVRNVNIRNVNKSDFKIVYAYDLLTRRIPDKYIYRVFNECTRYADTRLQNAIFTISVFWSNPPTKCSVDNDFLNADTDWC